MTDHGLGDLQRVSAMALKAGVHMDMVGEGFLTTLQKSLEEGLVTEKQINKAVRLILVAKYKLGLFDDPYKYCDLDRAENEIFTPANRKIARDIAAQSLVLLKNQDGILPLAKQGTIALIGPLADNRENMTGTWSVAANFEKSVSIHDGLKKAVGDKAKIVYAKGANVVADSLFESKFSIYGKPTYRDNRHASVMIQEALDVAKNADVIVAVMGEAAEMSGESSSLTNIDLPENQRDLLKALLKTGKPVVMVLLAGRPMTIKWEDENVSAILNAWFAGSEAGDAIADVLFGDVNPSGKLPATFPQNIGQVPIYYNQKSTGRPLPEGQWFQKFRSNYLDVSNDPLYPFGYGLSYTTFEYGDLKFSSEDLKGDNKLQASVDLKNTGKYDGAEVVQLYIRDLVASMTRPVKELKGFQKVFLKAGESKTITFDISTEDLKFYNYDIDFDWEPGEFEIMVGGNSRDLVKGKVNWGR